MLDLRHIVRVAARCALPCADTVIRVLLLLFFVASDRSIAAEIKVAPLVAERANHIREYKRKARVLPQLCEFERERESSAMQDAM